MSVKFIRTCDRCGKVIDEKPVKFDCGEASTKSNAEYNVISVECHPIFKLTNFHLCPDCCEDFESFMMGQLVCDISDREKDPHKQVTDTDIAHMYPATTIKKEAKQDGYVDTDTVEKETGWSPAVLELARKHNESCEKPMPVVSTTVDKSKIQLKPGTHTYHRWTKEEDQFIAFHSAGMTMNELANKFGVTLKAVQLRKSMILNGKVYVEKEDLK